MTSGLTVETLCLAMSVTPILSRAGAFLGGVGAGAYTDTKPRHHHCCAENADTSNGTGSVWCCNCDCCMDLLFISTHWGGTFLCSGSCWVVTQGRTDGNCSGTFLDWFRVQVAGIGCDLPDGGVESAHVNCQCWHDHHRPRLSCRRGPGKDLWCWTVLNET